MVGTEDMIMDNSEQARYMRQQGMTYREIGIQLGLSRQRAHQLVTGYVPPSKTLQAAQKALDAIVREAQAECIGLYLDQLKQNREYE